ncbi:hypothetical protein D3C77_426400 [compost metagenome]
MNSTIPVLLYQYNGPRRNIGFILSPLYLHDAAEPDPEHMLFIYDEDFIYIRPVIDKAFPLTDPLTGEEMEVFDPCWDNPILNDVWMRILEELDQQLIGDPELRVFLNQFTSWVKIWLESADGIEITGNL